MLKLSRLFSRFLMLLHATTTWAGDWGLYQRQASEVGFEYARDHLSGHTQHAIIGLQEKYLWSSSSDAMAATVHFEYRLLVDSERSETWQAVSQENLEKLIFYYSKPIGNWQVHGGWQQVSWGENLLLPILDVVNPRDLGYVRGYYDPGAKQASPMLLSEWKSGIWEAQVILAPWATKSRQPKNVMGFRLADQRQYRTVVDGEYGGRFGFLYAGVDTKFYYFHHQAREPSYRWQPFSGDTDIIIDEEPVDTLGATLSYAMSSLLIRIDLASHDNYPTISIAPQVERTRLTQGIFGLNWTSDDGQQSYGLEWHQELWQKLPEVYGAGPWAEPQDAGADLAWLGVTAQWSFLQSKLEPQMFYLQGLDNRDQLLRLLIEGHVHDSLSLGIEYQETHSRTTSPKVLLGNRQSLVLHTAYSW